MSNINKKMVLLGQLKNTCAPLSLAEISTLLANAIPERTLRRWLKEWVDSGVLQRSGAKRSTRYLYFSEQEFIKNQPFNSTKKSPSFLQAIPTYQRSAVLKQLRDLWTHSSTALEGNTLSLGDTHAVLGLGLTISGQPLQAHQEVIGHAKAIDLLYQALENPIDKTFIYALHQAVQTNITVDIYKPIGAWKVEVNGTYAVSSQGQQVFIEYAHPLHVDSLMTTVIDTMNTLDITRVTPSNAAYYYAKIHIAIVHIHPFWDGNGRIARLLANIILLKAGLPPLIIETSLRREYIECLADYQIAIGQLNNSTGVWPNEELLKPFILFCQQSYAITHNLLNL